MLARATLKNDIINLLLLLLLISCHEVFGKIEVIVAGLGRTGTMSLHTALDKLGYEGYHYIDFAHAQHWYDALVTGETSIDSILDRISEEEKYTAILDNPAADFFDELRRRFPQAYVILTVRDTPKIFAESWKELSKAIEVTERDFNFWSFPSFFQWIPSFWYLKRIRCVMGTTHLGLPPCHLVKEWDKYPEGWLEEQYERHNQYIMDAMKESPDKLLVFNVKEGWEPLCRFLGKPVPDESFPYVQVNTARGLMELKQTFLIAIWAWIPITILFIVAVMWKCFFCLFPHKKRAYHYDKEK